MAEQELLKNTRFADIRTIHSVKGFIQDPERESSNDQHTLCVIFDFDALRSCYLQTPQVHLLMLLDEQVPSSKGTGTRGSSVLDASSRTRRSE